MYFFARTQNPRPTFPQDMTPEERIIMQDHIAYWSEKAAKGIAIVFGPVMDPTGAYGILVAQAKDEVEMSDLIEHDPANNLLHNSIFPMGSAIVGTLHSY